MEQNRSQWTRFQFKSQTGMKTKAFSTRHRLTSPKLVCEGTDNGQNLTWPQVYTLWPEQIAQARS